MNESERIITNQRNQGKLPSDNNSVSAMAGYDVIDLKIETGV